MKREDFISQLERLLEGVAEEEKKEALSYYRSYFEDAGEENEERILKELESPEKVAATIKADLGMDGAGGEGEYTERGFEDSRFVQKNPVSLRKNTAGKGQEASPDGYQSQPAGSSQSYAGASGSTGHSQSYAGASGSTGHSQGYADASGSSGYSQGYNTGSSQGYTSTGGGSGHSQSYTSAGGSSGYGQSYADAGRGYKGYSSNSGDGRSTYSGRTGMEILLIVIIAVVTSPIWLGAVTGLAGGVLGLAIAAVCVAGSLFIAGFVLVGTGIGQMAAGSLAVGFGLSGAGLLLLALAVLAAILCVWVCGKLVPWLLRLVGKLWNSIFSGKEKRA